MVNIKGMELRLLLYFVTVAERLSFSKAAEQLNMAQPPLSQQIKMLEGRLGVELFRRDKRSVALTEAGAAFLPEAQDILSRTRNAMRHVQRVAAGKAGRIKVGLIHTGPYNPYVLEVLKQFGAAEPGVSLDLMPLASLEQGRALVEGRIDLAFHWPWPGAGEAGLETFTFPAQRFCIALPENHPLAKSAALNPVDLAGETWLMPEARHNPSWHAMALEVFKQVGFQPSHIVDKSRGPFILALVAAGQGVAVIPEFMSSFARGVAFVKFAVPCRSAAQISLCLSKKKGAGKAVENFYRIASKVKRPAA